jgi:hypothetical protein
MRKTALVSAQFSSVRDDWFGELRVMSAAAECKLRHLYNANRQQAATTDHDPISCRRLDRSEDCCKRRQVDGKEL